VHIRDKKGALLHEADRFHDLSDLKLRNAVLDGLTLQGVHFEHANLDGATLKNCELYWATFYCANLSGADFESGRHIKA
jgi:uncharacterized protein YjbI with pentapeptide repeats